MQAADVRDAVLDAFPVRDDTRLLDVGCGKGGLLEALHMMAPKALLVGLEVDANNAAEAYDRRAAQVVRGDGRSMPFRPNAFDHVILAKALHHMPPEVRRRTLEEVLRVLDSTGRLVVIEKARPGTIRDRLRLGWKVLLGLEDREIYSLFDEGLSVELQAAGFLVDSDRTLGRTRILTAKPQA
jgi:ubiquinone/menaquinone biosynthesis C-methylase UbiE